MDKFKKATKRIVAIAASTALVSASAFAFGNYPNNFVNSNNTFNGKVIVSADVGADDMAAAAAVVDDLKSEFSGDQEKVTISYKAKGSGNSEMIEDGSTKLYLNDALNTVKDKFDKDEFPTFLADGKLVDSDYEDNEYKYEQEIDLGAGAKAAFGRSTGNMEDSTDTPVSHLDLTNGPLYTLTTKFNDVVKKVSKTSTESQGLTDSETITLFGTDFTFDQKTTDSDDLTLYASSNTVVLRSDGKSSVSVEFDGTTYEVSLLGANSVNGEVDVEVNGKSNTAKEGTTKTIGGLKIYVDDVFVNDLNDATKTASARLFLGSDEIKIPKGARGTSFDTLEVNGDSLDGYEVRVDTYNSSTWDGLKKIEFQFTPRDLDNEIEYLKAGNSVQDPVFKDLSVSFDGMSEDLKADDMIKLNAGSEDMSIDFVNVDGHKFSLNAYTGVKSTINPAVAATKSLTSSGGSNFNVTANEAGDNGNTIKIVTEDTATAGAETVKVQSDTITIGIKAGITTVAQIKAAVAADPVANDLITVATSTDTVGVIASTALTGGADRTYTSGTSNQAVQLYNDRGALNTEHEVEKLVLNINNGQTLYKNNMFILNSQETSIEDEVTGVYKIKSFTEDEQADGTYDYSVDIQNLVTGVTKSYENGDEIEDTKVYVRGLNGHTGKELNFLTLSSSSSSSVALPDSDGENAGKYIVTNEGQKITLTPSTVKIEELVVDNRDSISSKTLLSTSTIKSDSNNDASATEFTTVYGSGILASSNDNEDNYKYSMSKTGSLVKEDIDSEHTSLEVTSPVDQSFFKTSINVGAMAETNTKTVLASEAANEVKALEDSDFTVISQTAVPKSDVTIDITAADIVQATEGMTVENAIVVGGPAVNAAARELLGVDSYDSTADEYVNKAGDAVARYFEASNSVLVYGYTKADTTAIVKELNAGNAVFK